MPMFFEIVAVVAGVIGMVIGASIGFCIGWQCKQVRQRTWLGAIGGAIGGFLFFVVASIVAYTLLPQKSVHTEWGTRTVPKISEEVLVPLIFGASFVGSIGGSIFAAISKKS